MMEDWWTPALAAPPPWCSLASRKPGSLTIRRDFTRRQNTSWGTGSTCTTRQVLAETAPRPSLPLSPRWAVKRDLWRHWKIQIQEREGHCVSMDQLTRSWECFHVFSDAPARYTENRWPHHSVLPPVHGNVRGPVLSCPGWSDAQPNIGQG